MKLSREHILEALDNHVTIGLPISTTYFENYTIRVESVSDGFDIRAQVRWCDHNLDEQLVCRLCGKKFRRV